MDIVKELVRGLLAFGAAWHLAWALYWAGRQETARCQTCLLIALVCLEVAHG